MKMPGKRREELQLEGEIVPYTLRRSRRAKRLLLHVDITGEIELVVPWHASYAEGRTFLQHKRAWIQQQRATQAARQAEVPRRALVSGTQLPCFGETVLLAVRAGKRARTTLKDNMLTVTTPNVGSVRLMIERWYRKQARIFFTSAAADLAGELHIVPPTVRITGARTQWGSCTPSRASVSFTWRLALAPPEVARYVAAHEVAHLRHARHSPAFWRLVERLSPDSAAYRRYLRTHGHTLEL